MKISHGTPATLFVFDQPLHVLQCDNNPESIFATSDDHLFRLECMKDAARREYLAIQSLRTDDQPYPPAGLTANRNWFVRSSLRPATRSMFLNHGTDWLWKSASVSEQANAWIMGKHVTEPAKRIGRLPHFSIDDKCLDIHIKYQCFA